MKRGISLILVSLSVFAMAKPGNLSARTSDEIQFRKFNLGISSGVGGIYNIIKPSIEIKCYDFCLRLSPGRFCHRIGMDYEFMKVTGNQKVKLKDRWYGFLLSTYYIMHHSPYTFEKAEYSEGGDYYGALLGARYQFDQHFVWTIKMGTRWGHRDRYYFEPFHQEPFTERSNFLRFDASLSLIGYFWSSTKS